MNVIITGASRGIGKAVAEVFASNQYNLFLTSQNEVSLYKAVEDLSLRYPRITVSAQPHDLRKKEEVIRFGEWCLSKASPDVLVNNAGNFEPGNVLDEADGILENQLSINVHSAYHLCRVIAPALIKKKSGHIFNMCSIASLAAYKNGGSYSISKYALKGLSDNLRNEVKSSNVKVTAVMPGAVMTDSWGDFDNSNNRIMAASDIASMIFACTTLSPAACVEEILIRPVAGDL